VFKGHMLFTEYSVFVYVENFHEHGNTLVLEFAKKAES